jgi:hypothetical protein
MNLPTSNSTTNVFRLLLLQGAQLKKHLCLRHYKSGLQTFNLRIPVPHLFFNHPTTMSDSENGEAGVPLFEGSDSSPPPSSKKRKHEAKSKEEKNSSKRRKLKKPKDVDDEALDTDLGVNHAVAHMDSRLMADHIAQRTKRFRPELSLVEVEEVHVPGGWTLYLTSLAIQKLMLRPSRESNRRHNRMGQASNEGESGRFRAAIRDISTKEKRS